MHKFQILVLALLLSGFAEVLSGQTGGGISPYSRNGLGDVAEPHLMYMRQMGGVAGGFADLYHLNISNPASYAYLKATSFDVGVSAKYARIKDNANSRGVWSGSLDYLALGFPLRNPINEVLDRVKKDYSLGMSLALMPHTLVGYNITSIEEDADFGSFERNFQGSGGTYKFLWGNSIKYKDFAFGVNLGYLFGKISYERNIFFTELENAHNNNFINDYSVSGFMWRAGAQYQFFLNREAVKNQRGTEAKILNIGVYGNSNTSFSTNSTVLFKNSFEIISGNQLFITEDTLMFDEDLKGSGRLPAEFGIGAMYFNGNKFALGVNFETSFWSNYKNDANPESLSDAYRVSFGGYFRPNYKSYNRYFQRVYYRFGAYYGKDPRSAEGDQLETMGLHLGMGLPFIYQRKISHVNLGLELGLRGRGAPIRETFLKITAGFTFNDDEWFIKRKYN